MLLHLGKRYWSQLSYQSYLSYRFHIPYLPCLSYLSILSILSIVSILSVLSIFSIVSILSILYIASILSNSFYIHTLSIFLSILSYIALSYLILSYLILHYIILYYIILYYILYYIILYYIILCYIMLCYVIVYYTISYYIILCTYLSIYFPILPYRFFSSLSNKFHVCIISIYLNPISCVSRPFYHSVFVKMSSHQNPSRIYDTHTRQQPTSFSSTNRDLSNCGA